MPRVINKVHIGPQFEYIIWSIDWLIDTLFVISMCHIETKLCFSRPHLTISVHYINTYKCIQ